MSNNINVAVLSGRVCADAELKYTNNGTAVCNFSIAVNKWRSAPDGQGREEVSFFNCAMYGKGAESFSQRLLKGVPVIVNGELRQDRWSDQDGKTQSRVSVVANRVEMVYTGRQNGSSSGDAQEGDPYPYSGPPARPAYGGRYAGQPGRRGYQAPPDYRQGAVQGTLGGTQVPRGVRPQDGQPYMAGPESFLDDDIPF